MSDTVTNTIACIGENLLNNHKLSIGIVICPILTNTIVTKKFAYTYDGLIRLKGTVVRDFLICFFLMVYLMWGPDLEAKRWKILMVLSL